MMQKILDWVKKQPITLSQWMVGFTGIMFVRFLFEAFSNPPSYGVMASDSYTLVHYTLFFLAVSLGTICVAGYFSKDYLQTGKFILFVLPWAWSAPFFDIFLSKGAGYKMEYFLDSHFHLFVDFFKFFSWLPMQGATYGMRIEIILLLIGVGYYVWEKRKSLMRAVLAPVVTYILIFIIGATPGLLYTFTHINNVTATQADTLSYVSDLVTKSNIYFNTLHEGPLTVSEGRFLQLGFDKLMSQILFLISFVFASLWFWKVDPKKFKTVLKNGVAERAIFYITLIFLGIGFAYYLGFRLTSWVDALGIICMIIAWVALWVYAVHVNDVIDVDIDKISNKNRPVVQNTISEKEMWEIGYVWLAVALLGAWSAGFYPFFMALVYAIGSYIYSAPPLRLKRIPVLASFLIGIACLVSVLAGFFFVSPDKTFQIFPVFAAIGILVMFTLELNVRDMKDVEGDRAAGIKTLPVIFGDKGPQVVGLCFALSFLLAPIFLSFYPLYLLSLPAAIVGYKLITKKPYKEGPVFAVHFLFIAGMLMMFGGIYWLAHVYNII